MKIVIATALALTLLGYLTPTGSEARTPTTAHDRMQASRTRFAEDLLDHTTANDRLRRAAAASDTTRLAYFTFDIDGQCSTQGWTSADVWAQEGDYFHVDDFSGLGGGVYGRLVPLEGNRSMWCGARPGQDPPQCGYATLPGYGDNWSQSLVTRQCLSVTGPVTVDYLVAWHSEPGYDYSYFQFDECDDNWRSPGTAGAYDGSGSGFESIRVPESAHNDNIRLRFVFWSDFAYSDADGLYPSDGALILDSLTVSDTTGVILATELFEDEAPGSNGADDWISIPLAGYGDFAALFPGIFITQEDPCRSNLTCMWSFYSGSTASYSCGGFPSQPAVPYQNSEGVLIRNEIWSPPIEWSGSGTTADLSFDVYRDLPMNALIFYSIRLRSIVNGCPGNWLWDDWVFYGPNGKDWYSKKLSISKYIDPAASQIQVALSVWDMCDVWGGIYGDCTCHSHAPLIDNVEVYRVNTTGPQIQHEFNLFTDNFSTDGTITGTVRADGSYIEYGSDPPVPWDEINFLASDPVDGIGSDLYSGSGPAVYLYASVLPPNQPGKTGAALTDDDSRFPVVDSLTIDGMQWFCIRTDTSFVDPDTRQGVLTNKWTADLNDNLFTPGDTVLYFFAAISGTPSSDISYFSRFTGVTADVQWVASNPMEFTCLPAGGYLRGGDILFVTNPTVSRERHFETAFSFLGIEDKVDRFDALRQVDPGNVVVDLYQQLIPCYRTIIRPNGPGDDAGLLFNFLHNKPTPGGVYISGDDAAGNWESDTNPDAIALRGAYMNFNLVNNNHVSAGFSVSPLVVGAPGSPFEDVLGPDTLVAYGGCPIINDFDVVEAAGSSTPLASYHGGVMTGGAIVGQKTVNSAGAQVGVVLSGFGFEYIRDDRPSGIPDRADHLKDILLWLQNLVEAPVGVNPYEHRNTLSQNHPNPFNPTTRIEFTVRESARVNIRIYNVAGQLVRTLVDEVKSPGIVHNVDWKGRNNAGQSVSSGVYFYRLTTKGFVQTKRMVLLK